MRRVGILLIVLTVLACGVVSCGASDPGTGARAPEPASVPETLMLPKAAEGWQDSYIAFMQENYDIFTALWPEGVSGVGFIDLDLDGTPEMVVFDQGASASLGAQIFDLIDGRVYCVSSTMDSAGGAFSGTYLSGPHVCTNFFESFRLCRAKDGWCFWMDSSNGTVETAWDEIVRFDGANGVLTPVSVCYRYLEFDPDSGLVMAEEYTVGGSPADAAGYQAAADIYQEGQDAGYEAKGVFRWNDYDHYSSSYDGFMAMVKDALTAYCPITDTVTLASVGK